MIIVSQSLTSLAKRKVFNRDSLSLINGWHGDWRSETTGARELQRPSCVWVGGSKWPWLKATLEIWPMRDRY